MRLSPRSVGRRLIRESIRGRWFRLYAPRARGLPPGPHLRIAIVSLIPHLGDSVMLLPLLDAIQQDQPDAEISVFSAGAGSLLALHPAVRHHYLYSPRQAWWKFSCAAPVWDIWDAWRREFKHLRFDVCIVPRGGVEPFCSPHLAWMLGANIRAGYSPKLEPELSAYDLAGEDLFTTLVTTPKGVHEVERGAEVLMLAEVLRKPVDVTRSVESLQKIARSEAGQQFVSQQARLADPYAIVAPGASFPRRRWSPRAFAEVAQAEMVDRHITPVFVGSPAERPLCESIAAILTRPALILTGTSFVELAALCLGAQFFVGNDSGPGHVAGAVGVPTVEVTAFSRAGDRRHHASPQRSHPCGPLVAVVQPLAQIPPCTSECVADAEHCIAQVPSSEVRSALHALLSAAPALREQ